MAVYYKFRSAKEFESLPIDDQFITVPTLKERIIETKKFRWKDHLEVQCAQTSQELDEAVLIPKSTSLIIRRLHGPVWSRLPIVIHPEKQEVIENNLEHGQPANRSSSMEDSFVMLFPEEIDRDDNGNDVYATPEVVCIQSDDTTYGMAPIEFSSLEWERQPQDCADGCGFASGIDGSVAQGGVELKEPPEACICYRCNVPGHFIQHCPSNGDPDDGIHLPKHPNVIAILRENEEVQESSSTRTLGKFPQELCCPLCQGVMREAKMTSRCCFGSFCDTCIRNHIISKSMCVCGARSVHVDDLLPNKTVMDTINCLSEINNFSAQDSGCVLDFQDRESARSDEPKAPMSVVSAIVKGVKMSPASKGDTPDLRESANIGKPVPHSLQPSVKKGGSSLPKDLSQVTHEQETTLQGSYLDYDEEVQQNLPAVIELNRTLEHFPAENSMIPIARSTRDEWDLELQASSSHAMTLSRPSLASIEKEIAASIRRRRKSMGMMEYDSSDDSSDDDRNFKRRRSWY